MELKYLWQIILRRKLLIISSSLLLLAVTIIICLTVDPVYETVARIKIKRADESHIVMSNAPSGFGSLDFIAPTAAITQAEVVKSSAVVEPVIRNLNLQERWTIIDTVVSFIPFLDNEEKTYIRMDDFVDASIVWAFLQKRDLIVEAVEDSDIVQIYAYSSDLEEAKNIANGVVASYIKFNETLKAQQGGSGSETIERQLQHAQKELETANRALQAFQKKEASLNFDDQSKAVADELQRLERELYQLRRTLKINKATMKAIERELKKQPDFKVTSKNIQVNPLIESVKEDLAELRTKLSGLLTDHTPNHIDAQSLKSQIKVLESILEEEPEQIFSSEGSTINSFKNELMTRYANIEIEYQELKAKEQALVDDRSEYKDLLSALAEKKGQLYNLGLAIEVAEKIYTGLNDNLASADLAISSAVANVTVITPAPLPKKSDPYYPEFALYVLIALFVAPMVAFGLALVVDYVDDSLKTRDEVEENLKLSILASFPRMKEREIGSIKSLELRAPFTKALVELRYNIREKLFGRDGKHTMAVVSVAAGEGKSMIIRGLASVLARNGKRVILLDLNLYAPILHTFFQLPPSPGIGEILLEKVQLDGAICPTDISNLAVIPCGEVTAEVIDCVASPKLPALIESLRPDYDAILMDTSAMSSGLEAHIAASCADGVVIVVTLGKTSRPLAKEAINRLESGEAKLLGLVLNRVAV